jgi:nucleoside-diphosphate-sugar epimerase
MHVLLIGGNRFVGRLLAWRLLARGDAVTLLNRGNVVDPFGDRVERIRCDRTTGAFAEALRGRSFDAAVDLAAFRGDDARGAIDVLRGRVRHHVTISTGQVYLVRDGCERPMRRAAREEDYDGAVMPRPSDPVDLANWEYGVGKRDCEDAIAAAARDGFPATRIRIPMVDGPLDYHRRLEGYLWRLVDGGPLLLPGGGDVAVRHVDGADVARFLASILLREETFGRAYNVAQDEAPSLSAIVSALRDLTGSAARVVDVAPGAVREAGLAVEAVSPFHDPWMSFLDGSRARDELGFRPRPVAQTLATVVDAFLAHTPPDRPPGYARRDVERTLAS